MRNLRKVVALVLAFAMVLSMSAVSFAAEMTAAEKAETLGVLQGEGAGVTAEYLAKTPTRLQAAIISLRLRGLEDEALAYEGEEMFADQEDITWAGGKNVAAYLKANPELGWIGSGDDMLKPNEPITAQAYVKVMLEALGYMQGTDFEWADVFTFAASKGLTGLTADTAMTNDSLAVGSVEALAATNADGEVLVDALVAAGAIDEDKAVAAGLVVEAMDFAVKMVEPFGLNAVKITFTSDIDDDETITVTAKDGDDDVTVDADYAVDGNVLVAVFGTIDNTDYDWTTGDDDKQDQTTELDLEITATGVDGIEVDEEEAKVTMTDKVDPELVSVTVENAKTFKVKYSEPIDPGTYENGYAVFDDVKLDDAKLAGRATWSKDLTEITYTLNDAVAANSYVFTMEAVADFAGFVAPSEAVTVTVVADDAAPQLVSVEATDITTVELTFDEDVADIGIVEINGVEYEIDADANTTDEVSIDGEVVTVDITSNPLDSGDAFVAVKGDYSDVEDVIGNKSGDDIEFTFLAPFDDEVPTVSISVSKKNYLVLDFSEEVSGVTDANIFSLLSVKDDDGDSVADGTFFAGTGNVIDDETSISGGTYEDEEEDKTIYLVELKTPAVNETEYTVTFDGTVDGKEVFDGSVLANEVQETEATIMLNDLKAPSVEDVVVVDATADKQIVRIGFNEEMNESTLEDIGNYLFGTTTSTLLPLKEIDDVTLTASDDLKSVDIYIPKKVLDGQFFKILSVEDQAENTVNGAASTAFEIEALADVAFGPVTVTLTAADTIEIKAASSTFVEADADDFEFYEGGVTTSAYFATSAVIDGSKITLTLNKDLKADGTTDNATAFTMGTIDDDTLNTYDKPLVIAPAALRDGVAATAEIVGDEDNKITINFDEVLDDVAQVANDVIVRDEDGDVISVSVTASTVANVTQVVITGTDLNVTSDTTFTVEIFSRFLKDAGEDGVLNSPVGDVDDNLVNALAETEVTVK